MEKIQKRFTTCFADSYLIQVPKCVKTGRLIRNKQIGSVLSFFIVFNFSLSRCSQEMKCERVAYKMRFVQRTYVPKKTLIKTKGWIYKVQTLNTREKAVSNFLGVIDGLFLMQISDRQMERQYSIVEHSN